MSITIIEVRSAKIIHKFHTFVQPTHEKQIHEATLEKLGITNEMIFPQNGLQIPNIYLAL